MESHVVDVSIAGRPFRFNLQRKDELFGPALVDHWWIDLRLLTPKPGRSQNTYKAVCDAFHALATAVPNLPHLTHEVIEVHLLARLHPWVRSLAGQKVLADARPTAGRKANEERIHALSDVLRRDALAPVTEEEFHLKTKACLRSATFSDRHRRLYQGFCRQLFESVGQLWLNSPEEAVKEVRRRWTAWTTGFGRRRGREDDKLILDVLSYESGAAWRQCYSACWSVLLPELHARYGLTRVSYQFLEYWHQQVLRERWNGKFDVFHGHVLGLHPAGSPFVQTPEGRGLLGEWLADAVPPPDLGVDQFPEWAAALPTRRPYQRLLRGLMLAVLMYSLNRDDANSVRRGRPTKSLRRMAAVRRLRLAGPKAGAKSDDGDD